MSRSLPAFILFALLLVAPCAALAEDSAMVRLLKTGRVPHERLATVVNLICQRGNEQDLTYVFDRATATDGLSGAVREQALQGLAAATQTRKVTPQVEIARLAPLFGDKDPATRRAAIALAGSWKAAPLAAELENVLLSADVDAETQRTALSAIVALGDGFARPPIDKLLASTDKRQQALGVAGLTDLDVDAGAKRAAAALAAGPDAAQIATIVDAFLKLQKGADKLAAALDSVTLSADSAKLALRHLYINGRSDPALASVLGKAAGLDADRPPPTPEVLKSLTAEVLANGDAARGETIFRRADLGCMKCHAVSGAGGDVGPDLSAVGATSPVDYVITSILHPDLSIKEVYLTRNIVTTDGKVYQGIVVDRDANRIVLKDGSGAKSTIATADIDEEVEGKSLMPKGLAAFLTDAEFLDLVRFISELGKPGSYAIRSQQTVQRWRYLGSTNQQLAESVPDEEAFGRLVREADESQWLPAYAKVAGELPWEELTDPERKVLYLRGDFELNNAGPVEVRFNSPDGLDVWIDGQKYPTTKPVVAKLESGAHSLYVRVDPLARANRPLRAVVDKAAPAQFRYTVNVIGGR